MQTTDLLCRNAQYQPCARVLRPHLHHHNALVRAHRHRRQNLGRSPHSRTTCCLTLLQAANEPWQQSHGPHKKDHDDQGLGHAATIHG